MVIGKVVGSVVSTRKNTNLIGNKFLIIEPIEDMGISNKIVAIDNVGAVLVATGSAARVGCGQKDAPIDAAIVGIVDEL